MASPGVKGRGAGRRPIPGAEGKCSHLSQGLLAPPPRTRGEGVCRAEHSATLPSESKGWAGSEQVPPPSPVTLSTPHYSHFLSPQNEDMLDTPCASQSLIPKIAPRKPNTGMKLLLLRWLSFTPWAQKARASVRRSKGASVCKEVDTHPRAGSFLGSLSS